MAPEGPERPARRISEALSGVVVTLVAVPIVGLLFGGIYSIPADNVTRGREPWFTILLGVGLATSVLVLGLLDGLAWTRMLIVASVAWMVLLLRRALGKLNMESFAQVHILTILLFAFFR